MSYLFTGSYQLKEDFGIGRISTGDFLPNWADLELKILAFNLLVLYQRQACLPCSAQAGLPLW